MVDDLSEKQREIVERIAGDVVKKTIARPHEAEGDPKLPDIGLTHKIAQDEISEWDRQRPRWWNIRWWNIRRNQLAGTGFVGFLMLCIFDLVFLNKHLVSNAIHWLVGTETRIDDRLTSLLGHGRNGNESDPAKLIDAAFKSRLDDWTKQEEFREKSREVLEGMAKDGTDELKKLVIRTLNSQPILMFQAQARLGSRLPVQVNNRGCEYLVNYWYERRPETLPEIFRSKPGLKTLKDEELLKAKTAELAKLLQACKADGSLARDASVNIPFWARFHPDRDGQKDKVSLLLYVKRTLTEVETLSGSGFRAAEDQSQTADSHNPNAPSTRQHPYANELEGLKIEYNPSKQDRIEGDVAAIDIHEILRNRYGGFWHGTINDIVVKKLESPPDSMQVHDLIHSLTVSLPERPDNPHCEKTENQATATNPHPACLNEIVEVTAIVMVNNKNH